VYYDPNDHGSAVLEPGYGGTMDRYSMIMGIVIPASSFLVGIMLLAGIYLLPFIQRRSQQATASG
jgi:hypothetical protein